MPTVNHRRIVLGGPLNDGYLTNEYLTNETRYIDEESILDGL